MSLGMVEGCQCKRRCFVQEASKCGQYTRIIGRKRVVTPHAEDALQFINTSFKKRFRKRPHLEGVNRLELLPQDILIRVLCGVNHSNLRELLLVSKAVHNVALMAKKLHFDFSTPNSKVMNKGDEAAGNVNEVDHDSSSSSHETPGAPIRVPKSRLGGKDLSNITVALFTEIPEGGCN